MKFKFLILALALPFICSAQRDSAVIYINKEGNETTKDSAFIYGVFTKHDALWYGKVYYSKNDILQSQGDYAEMNFNTPVGRFNNYLEDGSLSTTCNYDSNGKLTDKTYYYKNGNKRSYIAYNDKGKFLQKGWDESGKEIPNFISEEEARFKGDAGAWNRYLEKHLDVKVAVEAGMPAGEYEVIVQFTINYDGTIINVKAASFTGNCKACANEAVGVITNAPSWQPAIQNNEPVIYRQKQKIVFRVTESKRNKRS